MKAKFSKLVAGCLTMTMAFGTFSAAPFAVSAAEVSPTIIGDVDGDGEVTIHDATLLQYYLAELAEINDAQKFVADVDDDGEVTIHDATMIQYYLAELIDGFTKQPGQQIEYSYVVAGTLNLTAYDWVASTQTGNVMTKNTNGTYSLTFKDVMASDDEMQFKVVGIPVEGGDLVWFGADGTSANYSFRHTMDGDVTVTFDPKTKKLSASGNGVEPITGLNVTSITAVGSGSSPWLNGIAWDQTAAANHMTEIEPGLYRIAYNNVKEDINYEIKFAANDSWSNNWGIPKGVRYTPGEWADAEMNAENIRFDVDDDLARVVVTFDLRQFDYSTKQGARFCINIFPAN